MGLPVKRCRGWYFCTALLYLVFSLTPFQTKAEEPPGVKTWELLWETQLEGSVRAGPVVDLDRRQVFVGDGHWIYHAIGLENGALQWSYQLNGPTFSAGVVYEELLIIGSRAPAGQSTVKALSTTDGAPRWETRRFSFVDRPIYSFEDDVLVIGYKRLELVDPKSGQSRKVIDQMGSGPAFFDNALLYGEILYYEMRDPIARVSTLNAKDLKTNTLMWRITRKNSGTHRITVNDSYLAWVWLGGDLHQWTVALADRSTGISLSQYTTAGHVRHLQLTDRGLIVLEDRKITLWSHDLTERIWEVETRFGGYAEPLVVGNTVLVGGFDEDGLMALSLADGSLKARYPLDDREASGYWVSEARDLLVFTEADDYPLPGPRYVRAFRVDPSFWD